MSTYLFDSAAPEASERFSSLEHCYDKVTTARFEEFGVTAGWRCLEVGGGGGSIARWLTERVGPDGSVLATDIHPDRMYGSSGNLEIRRHDIVTDDLPSGQFDLVHARLVLIHIPERRRAVERILRALKPGGILLLDEFDLTWTMPVLTAPEPRTAALVDKIVRGVHGLLEKAGMDAAWARTAYQTLRETGYTDLGFSGFAEPWNGGSPGAHLHRANAQQVSGQLLAEGLASEAELQEFLGVLDEPALTLGSYLMLSTWGRRPV